MTAAVQPSPRIAAGLAWTVTAMVTTRLVTLVGLSMLARLLSPEDFGLLAFALAYITYVTAVGDLGTGMALIYWPSRTEDAAQITFAVSMAMSVICLGATLMFASAIAAFFENPAGTSVLVAIAWSLPLQALGSTHDALCRKSLRFRAWLVPELGLAAGKAVISIGLAIAGFGVWSLVWGHLAGHLLRSGLLWALVPWRPALRMPWDLVRPMFAYGRSIVGINILSAIVHHSDLLIVARALGVTALGFYQMAAKIPEMAITLLVRAVSSVLFPALSQVYAQGRNPAQTYLTTMQGVALVTVPGAVVLVFAAEPLVLVALGPRWAPSIPVVQALTVVATLRALGTHAGDLLKASGRPAALVVLASIKALLLIPALIVAAKGGIVTVAVAMIAVAAATMTLDVLVACRCSGVSGRLLLDSIRGGITGAVALGAGLTLVEAVLPVLDPPTRLAALLASALVIYSGALHVANPRLFARVMMSGRQLATRVVPPAGRQSRPLWKASAEAGQTRQVAGSPRATIADCDVAGGVHQQADAACRTHAAIPGAVGRGIP